MNTITLQMNFQLKLFPYFRAAEKGNFEAAVKLGIAYLYNEGRKLSSFSSYGVITVNFHWRRHVSWMDVNDRCKSCWWNDCSSSLLPPLQLCWAMKGELMYAVGKPPTSSAWRRACSLPKRIPSLGFSSVLLGRPLAAAARPWCSIT